MATGKELAAVADVSGAPAGTDATIISDLITAVNALLAELRDADIMDV